MRLQEGFDFSQHEDPTSKIKNSTESLPRNQSYSHMSQASSNSDLSVPNTPVSRHPEAVNISPNAEDSGKKAKSIGGSLDEIVIDDYIDRGRASQMFLFQKKQKRGVIDVWWLYDDGGKSKKNFGDPNF